MTKEKPPVKGAHQNTVGAEGAYAVRLDTHGDRHAM